MQQLSVDFAAVEAAARRIRGIAHRTPVVRCTALDEVAGHSLYLKCENLQRVGAFKFRGAYNALSSLEPGERARGVVAFSSGNHAQGVALAAQLLDIRATIIMPENANPLKLAATRAYGADVITFDPAKQTREEIADRLVRDRDLSLIPPFDHDKVIAGQATAALELLEEVPDLDVLVAPAGGGGLLAGSAIAARAMRPAMTILGSEPEAGNDWFLSWERGEPVTIPQPQTIADGLRLTHPGRITWPIVRATVDGFVTVSELQIVDAMRMLFERAKLVVEPAGAVPVAAALFGKIPGPGKSVGIIISGGNIDARSFASIVAS